MFPWITETQYQLATMVCPLLKYIKWKGSFQIILNYIIDSRREIQDALMMM